MDRQYKNLYNLCLEFYRYEEFLSKKKNGNDNEGYLIEKNSIEELKQNIFYDELKDYSDHRVSKFNTFVNNPKVKVYLDKYKEIERNIIQMKFKNGEKLIKSLNDNKKYYLISKPLWNKICKCENKEDKGIPFSFEENNIILYLNNDTDILYFKIKGGIIEKSNFIENKSFYNKSTNNKDSFNIINKFKLNNNQSHVQLSGNNQISNLLKIVNQNNINIRLDMLNSGEDKERSIDNAQETHREFSDNIKKIKLSSFAEKQIKASILYYFFYLRLENDVKNSNIDIKNSECYLINKDWMNKFKEFYLYEKLVKNIKSIMQSLNVDINSENIDKKIYDNLDEEFLKEINEKEDNYSDFFDYKNKISSLIGKINGEKLGEIKYYYGFDILSVNVYNLIVERKNSSFNLIKKDYLINDGKIIIKFEEEYKIKLIVGHFDFINHYYFSENLLYYNLDKKYNDFEYLKTCHYNKFIKENIYNQKYLIKNHQIIGKIIELNNQNNGILEGDENKIDDDEINSHDLPQNILNLQSKNNIEFLLRLYFYYKSFKERFNNPICNKQNQETGYIINKNLIEKYKEYYNYNELKKFCDSKTTEVKSLIEFENSFKNLRRILPNTYIEEINKKDNNSSINALLSNNQIVNQNLNPDNCVVLDEKLINLLYNLKSFYIHLFYLR